MATLVDSKLSHRTHAPLQHWYSRRSAIPTLGLTVLIIGGAIALRLASLDAKPFWVDEAESSINALTILEKGVPTDSYLGLPIYENTLIEHWPSNPEYEFRDLSYSDKPLAIYHGWLPLYAIAASFAVQGIAADQDDGSRFIKHDIRERKRRTRAARLPSVLMGTLFLIIAFAGASLFYGRDAGWAALMVGTIYPYHVTIS